MHKFAKIISIIGHPLFTIPLYVTIIAFRNEVFSKAVLITFLITGCIFIPVILWMSIKSGNGSYTNFDVSDQIQRRSLFLFAIPLLTIVTVLVFMTDQTKNLCFSMLFGLILVIVSQVLNFSIKSSLHVSLHIYLSALIAIVNYKVGIIVLLFSVPIGWSRSRLGRHSKKEILAGSIIGTVISAAMLLVEIWI